MAGVNEVIGRLLIQGGVDKGSISKAVNELGRIDKAIDKTGKGAGQISASTEKTVQSVQRVAGVAGTALTAFGVGVAAALFTSTKAASDFQSAFAAIEKTVDATPEGFAKINKEIRQLAREIPVAATELAELGGIAGQLGVKKDDIVAFTETVAKLGVASDLTGEDAAVMLARFKNVSGFQGTYEDLGNVIVGLGNNVAATESEISTLALRLAAAGRSAGIGAGDILAMAASLKNVGVEAESGGTAFSKLIISINNAVAMGGDQLQDFANVAGQSAADFKKSFKDDATGAVIGFLEGLQRLEDEGTTKAQTLDDIGLKGARLADVLGRASSATENFGVAMKISSAEISGGSALADEAAKRFETFESKVLILKNKLTDIAITIGGPLVNALSSLIDTIGPVVDAVADFAAANPNLTATITLLVGALGAIATVVGPLLIAFSLMSTTAIPGMIASVASATAAIGGGAGLTAVLIAAAPFVAALGGAAVIAGLAFVDWGDNIDDAKVAVQSYVDEMRTNLFPALDETKGKLSKSGGEVETYAFAWQGLKNILSDSASFTAGIDKALAELAKRGRELKSMAAILANIGKSVKPATAGLEDFAGSLDDAAKSIEAQAREAAGLPPILKKVEDAVDDVGDAVDDLDTEINQFSFGPFEREALAAAGSTRGYTASLGEAAVVMTQLANDAAPKLAEVMHQAGLDALFLKESLEFLEEVIDPTTQAFERLSSKSIQELGAMREAAERDFELIKNSGKASAQQIEEAWQNVLKARIAELEASGALLTKEQAKQLDTLKGQLETFSKDTIGPSGTFTKWGEGIQSVIESLNKDIVQGIFKPPFDVKSMGNKLKTIADSFKDALVAPILQQLNELVEKGIKFLMGWLDKLFDKLADKTFDLKFNVTATPSLSLPGIGGGGPLNIPVGGGGRGGGGGGEGSSGAVGGGSATTAGAAIGTAILPGLGTAIGASIGAAADLILAFLGNRRREGTLNAIEGNTRVTALLMLQNGNDAESLLQDGNLIGDDIKNTLSDSLGQLQFINASLDTIKGSGVLVRGGSLNVSGGGGFSGGSVGGGGRSDPPSSAQANDTNALLQRLLDSFNRPPPKATGLPTRARVNRTDTDAPSFADTIAETIKGFNLTAAELINLQTGITKRRSELEAELARLTAQLALPLDPKFRDEFQARTIEITNELSRLPAIFEVLATAIRDALIFALANPSTDPRPFPIRGRTAGPQGGPLLAGEPDPRFSTDPRPLPTRSRSAGPRGPTEAEIAQGIADALEVLAARNPFGVAAAAGGNPLAILVTGGIVPLLDGVQTAAEVQADAAEGAAESAVDIVDTLDSIDISTAATLDVLTQVSDNTGRLEGIEDTLGSIQERGFRISIEGNGDRLTEAIAAMLTENAEFVEAGVV